jgi:hypothetical protein
MRQRPRFSCKSRRDVDITGMFLDVITMSCTSARSPAAPAWIVAPDAAPPAAPAEPLLADELWISDEGDVVAPDGYFRELSEVLITLLRAKAPGRNRRKYLRRLRQFLAFRLRRGERWDAFLTEDDRQAFRRIKAYLESINCTCSGLNNSLDDTCDVTHRSMAYVRVALVAIRQLYTLLALTGMRGGNPANVPGWDEWDVQERLSYALAVGYHKYGIRSAGHRFIPRKTASPFLGIYDPYECSSRLAKAVEAVCAPASILHLNRTLRLNGLRPSDLLRASALGWAQGGLGDLVWVRNKREGEELVKLAVLPRSTEAWLRERFGSRPHPEREGATLLDHIHELAVLTGLGSRKGAGARRRLRAIKLFNKEGTDDGYTYEGIRYWIRVAVLEGEDEVIRVASSQGFKEPSLIFYRKAAISRDVRELLERTKDEAERSRGLEAIALKYRHKTDQTQAYADFEYLREALRSNQDLHEREDADIAADRAASPAPVRSLRLAAPTAQAAWERLQGRPS